MSSARMPWNSALVKLDSRRSTRSTAMVAAAIFVVRSVGAGDPSRKELPAPMAEPPRAGNAAEKDAAPSGPSTAVPVIPTRPFEAEAQFEDKEIFLVLARAYSQQGTN